VEVEGDSGTGTSYLEVRYGRFGVSYVVAGWYDDVGWTGDEMHYLRPKG